MKKITTKIDKNGNIWEISEEVSSEEEQSDIQEKTWKFNIGDKVKLVSVDTHG